MITGVTRTFYKAPCRWYQDGPVGTIRIYRAKPTANIFPGVTVFHPYNQLLQLENTADTGEITGKGLRKWDNGVNLNNLQGWDYEGTLLDHRGLTPDPFNQLTNDTP